MVFVSNSLEIGVCWSPLKPRTQKQVNSILSIHKKSFIVQDPTRDQGAGAKEAQVNDLPRPHKAPKICLSGKCLLLSISTFWFSWYSNCAWCEKTVQGYDLQPFDNPSFLSTCWLAVQSLVPGTWGSQKSPSQAPLRPYVISGPSEASLLTLPVLISIPHSEDPEIWTERGLWEIKTTGTVLALPRSKTKERDMWRSQSIQ